MTRGDGGRLLFEEEDDYSLFMNLLRKAKKRFSFELFAYCLMPNHLHLLIRISTIPLSAIMHWLQLAYAKRFNKQRARWGHVFQDRFQSRYCANDGYFLRLLSYIHRNPVKSGLVGTPSQWPWSGHRALIGLQESSLIDRAFPLSVYSGDQNEAVRLYLESLSEDTQDDEEILDAEDSIPAPSLDEQRPPAVFDWRSAAAEVSDWTGIGLPALLGSNRDRPTAKARHLLIRRMVTGGMRPMDIAEAMGCSPALVSKASLTL